MIAKSILKIFWLVVFTSFLGCSVKHTKILTPKQVLANPYTLEVVEELYDGETLFLQVELKELTTLPDKLTLISLAGFNDQQDKKEKFFNLQDLQTDSKNQITLAIPVKNLVEYQIQLFWGKQAWSFYTQIYPLLASNLDIINGEVEKLRECQLEDCQIKFKIKFDLLNKNEITVPKINLTLSLLENTEVDGLIIPNELFSKNIPINDLNLAADEVRQLEYIIAQPKELNELNTLAEVSISEKL